MKKENIAEVDLGCDAGIAVDLIHSLEKKQIENNLLKKELDAAKKREEISRLILRINTPGKFNDYMSDLTDALQLWSGCEAVGIRLQDQDDYPYFETKGFPAEFIRHENKLCRYGPDGTPALECMCGNILCGRIDSQKPFFTPYGSFWSNNTTELIAHTTIEDRQVPTRNFCNKAGYESVALIPLKADKEVFGLLQFNDHRPERFSLGLMNDFEKIADCLSFSLLHRKAERDLKKSEHKWATTLSSIGDAIIATDKNRNITFFNPVAEKLTGWTHKNALGQKIELVFNPAVKKSSEEANSCLMLSRKDGTEISVEITESPIEDEEEGQTGTVIIFRDITLRNLAEAELREKEFQFQNLADSGLALIWTSDESKLCNYFNKAWLSFTGKTLEEELGNGWATGVHPDDFDRCLNTFVTAFDQRSKFDMEYRLRHVSGEYRWIRDLGTPNYNSTGKFIGYIGHCFDITENKLSEAVLRENEQNLQSLLELTQKNKSEIQIQNERLESLHRISQYKFTSKDDLLGYVLQEAINLTFSQVGYIFSYDESSGKLNLNSASSEVMQLCEVENFKTQYDLDSIGLWGEPIRQKREIVVNDYAIQNRYKKGIPEGHLPLDRFLSIPIIIDDVIVGVIGVANKKFNYEQSDVRQLTLLMDTTWRMLEHEEMIDNLKIAKIKAEESEKLKSAFLANMSHEIRTPMNGILGFAELLKEPDLSGKEKEEYLSIIEKSGKRMLNIINDIISISKLESGLMQISLKETNINDQITYIYTFFKPEAEKKGIKISWFHGLSDQEAIIKTDREKLYAILTNLVKNAIKFTWQGSIDFGYQKKDNYLEFYVKDTGNGIQPEQLNIIFERFRQGNESLTRNYEGAGLGLSISKAYVEMLGGKIWVTSRMGKGSCFYFTLPCNNEIPQEKDSLKSGNNVLNKPHPNLKILIAEDDELSFVLLKKAIHTYAGEIIHAKTGYEAVKIASEDKKIDLILMDVRMPELDGYTALKKIREANQEVIIIIQTAFALESDKIKAMEKGCNDYISKPIKPSELRAMLDRLLEERYNKVISDFLLKEKII